MNRIWHDAHQMPRAATLEQRITWHVEHAKNCGCRPIPAGVMALIEARNMPMAISKRATDERSRLTS